MENVVITPMGEPQPFFSQWSQIGPYVRQAVTLVRLDDHRSAEETLNAGLAMHPGNVDLIAQLGWVYKRWRPTARIADARDRFSRAAELDCQRFELFRHWTELEYEDGEWDNLNRAAEAAIRHFPDSILFKYRAGYALSRLSRRLWRGVQLARAKEEARKAIVHLSDVLKDHGGLEHGELMTHGQSFRSIVLTYETLIYISRDENNEKDRALAQRECAIYLRRWLNEHPEDSYGPFEEQRLSSKWPDLKL